MLLLLPNLSLAQRSRPISPSQPVTWIYNEKDDSTWEDLVNRAIYMDGLMPGYLDTVMAMGVREGNVRDDGAAWVISIPDSLVWPPGIWDNVVADDEAPMLVNFKLALFKIDGSDTTLASPSYLGYKQISINKASKRVVVVRANRRNPPRATFEQLLSPAAYVRGDTLLARFKSREKDRKKGKEPKKPRGRNK